MLLRLSVLPVAWRPCLRAVFAVMAAVVMLAALPACSSSGTGKRGTDYVAMYNNRQYADAYEVALEQSKSGPAPSREQAQLIAGLSAAALNKNSEAEGLLRPLLKSQDQIIAGKAGSQLGLIAAESGRNAEAAQLLTDAMGKLKGDEAARAALYAGDAYRAQQDTAQATAMYEKARGLVVNDQSLHVMISDRMASVTGQQLGAGTGKFTVSLGSFNTYQRAQAQADRYRGRAQTANLATPRIVQVTVNGKQLYGVRVGRFADRAGAEKAKQALGPEAAIATTTEK